MGGAESRQRAGTRAPRHSSRLADRPLPPGKPLLVPSDKHASEPDVVTIRWEPPFSDGGAPITGYLVEHRRTGSPHWVRSSPSLVREPELTLSGLEPGWRYQFRVSAQNAIGLSEPGELSDLLTVTLQRTAASAPFFVRELRDTVALENEKAELTVQVRGTPTPTLAWYKDGIEVFSSRSYRVVTDNETSTLIIHQAALSDEGEIKCAATNRVGYAVTRARLTLESPPSIRLPRQYEEGLLFEKDEVIRLKVSVAGKPVPEVTWSLNGEPVGGGGRYEVAHSERYATLRVGEARRSDRGEYTVRAVNRLGEDTASFLVTVADRPMPPGQAKVVMTLGKSVTLSWITPEDDGGCKIGNYIVEYYRLGWNMWLKAATCRQLTTTLGDLIEGSEYKFRVKAENPYGVSDPSQESEVVFIPDPKRGLLEPPEHKPADKEMTVDIWLEEKKRAMTPSPIDEQYGERKTKKKRGPLLPPQGAGEVKPLEQTEIAMMSEDMSPPVTPEGYRPAIPKRRSKLDRTDVNKELEEDKELSRKINEWRQREDRGKNERGGLDRELQEEKELARKLNERRMIEERKRVEMRKSEELRRIEELKRAEEFKKGVDETEKKLEKGNKNVITSGKHKGDTKKLDLSGKKEVDSPQSPLSPRSDVDHLHGSSELMLVLLPHSRATTEERETSKRELFESSMALEGEVAPPMSLSAPELGSGDPPEPPLMRSAFSSTELLHDRAMARFYQDMAEEEAEALKRRGSLRRRQSFGSRTRVTGSLQDIRSSMKSLNDKSGPTDNSTIKTEEKKPPAEKESQPTPKLYIGRKALSKDSMDSVLSIEDLQRKPSLVQQPSEEDMEYEDSSFDEDEEDEYDEEEEDEEFIADYIVNEALEEELEEEEEEEEDEEYSNGDKRGSVYTSESEEETRYPYSLERDNTIRGRIRASTSNYTEDSMISAYEGRGPLILPSVPQVSVPPVVTEHNNQSLEKEAVPNSNIESRPKSILKRLPNDLDTNKKVESAEEVKITQKANGSSLVPEKRYEPNFNATLPKPILKVRDTSQERTLTPVHSKDVLMAAAETKLNLSSSRSNIDEGSDYESGTKKKQVRIEEPDEIMNRGLTERRETDNTEPKVGEVQSEREKRGSLGDDVEATRVLIDHYSHIVSEYGRGKRPPKTLYLNYEALKAAAEREEENQVRDIPEIIIDEPEFDLEPQVSSDFENETKTETPVNIYEPAPEIPTIELPEQPWEASAEIKKDKSPPPEKRKKKRTPSPRKRTPSVIVENVTSTPSQEKTEKIRTRSPSLPRPYTPTEKKVHSYFDFLMDFSLFVLACWLYLFKDERLSIPVLVLMIYRQAQDAFQRKMEALRNKTRRLMFWKRN